MTALRALCCCVLFASLFLPLATQAGETTLSVKSRLLGNRVLHLPPDRAIDLLTHCRFENETGYKGEAQIEVVKGVVKQMHATFDVPDYGRCEFGMAGMTQAKAFPTVELRNRGTGCTVRMWEQGEKATVSFSHCESACVNSEAFKYVWPILVTRTDGHCD